MRNKTQERVEELARERAATAIDLALVEEGIEIGKKMMAEMIATYPTPGKAAARRRRVQRQPRGIATAADASTRCNGRRPSGYLNEVRA